MFCNIFGINYYDIGKILYSLSGFDELNNKNFPGETLALKEVLGLNSIRIQHSQLVPDKSFIVIE